MCGSERLLRALIIKYEFCICFCSQRRTGGEVIYREDVTLRRTKIRGAGLPKQQPVTAASVRRLS